MSFHLPVSDTVLIPAITALLVWLLNHFTQDRQARLDRRKERISEQIQQLYGKLLFDAEMNGAYFRRHDGIGSDYMAAQASTSGIDEKLQLTDASLPMASIRNEVTATNARMIDLIRTNAAFIHLDDLALFRQFAVDHNRTRLEKDMPDALLDLNTMPAWWQPKVCEAIVQRGTELLRDLDGLSRPFWKRLLKQ